MAMENPKDSGRDEVGVTDDENVPFSVAVAETKQPLLLQVMSLEEGNCEAAEIEELDADESVSLS